MQLNFVCSSVSSFFLLQTTASPTKNLFGKSFDSQSLFMDDASSSENHDNSDEEADYYFSDMEN